MTFLANLHTGEFHDLSATTANCQIGEIKHHRRYRTLDAARGAGFDPCDYCLPQLLAAKPRVSPRPVQRAATVTLSGKKSTPRRGANKVTEYLWTITPDDDAGEQVTTSEPEISFVILGTCSATLRVTNAQGDTHEKTIQVGCHPRQWHKLDWITPVQGLGLQLGISAGGLAFGRNTCWFEATTPDQSSGHFIHRSTDEATWQDEYTRAQVPDADLGPWHGCWYADSHQLKVQRAELRSRDLFPGSDLWQRNLDAELGPDIRAVRASVEDHEHFHTQISYRIWQVHGMEPVRALEALIGSDEDDLIDQADEAIRETESLFQAPQEADVHQRMQAQWGGTSATILVHDGDGYTTRQLDDLSQVGDLEPET
jgi:hypothetical protein